MGQYWEIINYDTQEQLSLNAGVKLGEFFFSGELHKLAEVLIKPMVSDLPMPTIKLFQNDQ